MNSAVLRRFNYQCTTSVATMSGIRYRSGRAGASGAGAAVECHDRRRCVTPSSAASEAINKVLDTPTTAPWVAGRAGKMRMSSMAGKFCFIFLQTPPSVNRFFDRAGMCSRLHYADVCRRRCRWKLWRWGCNVDELRWQQHSAARQRCVTHESTAGVGRRQVVSRINVGIKHPQGLRLHQVHGGQLQS